MEIEEWAGGPSRPHVYLIKNEGSRVATTYSRNWAILRAYREAGRTPFARREGRALVRVVDGPMYLPQPIARLLAIVGPDAPAPELRPRPGGLTPAIEYWYRFPTQRLLEQVVEFLGLTGPEAT